MNAMKLLRSFAGNRKGVSALEFAIVLPIMVTLYLGGVEVSTALTLYRKVTHVTSAISDLVTQAKTISNTDMTNILDAAASIITPFDATKLHIKVSEAAIDATTGVATVFWSDARNASALSTGSVIALPAAIAVKGTHVVTAEVHYDYTPAIGYVMTGTFDLLDKFYLSPRLVNHICRPPTTTNPC